VPADGAEDDDDDDDDDEAVSEAAGIGGSGSGRWKSSSLEGNRSLRAWARK
jgi:hypothetical protein